MKLRSFTARGALRLPVVLAALVLAACTSYLDDRAERSIREALPRVIGPAASYEVEVSGSSADATRFERVHVAANRVARERTPVIDRIELDLRGAAIDRREKRLSAVDSATGQARVLAADVAGYLQQGGWVDDARVRFAAPNAVVVSGTPKLAGFPLAARDGAEFRGRFVAQGSQLRLAIDQLRLGTVEAPPLLRALLERAVNPLLDSQAYPLPAQMDAVSVEGDALLIKASGSRLPSSANAALVGSAADAAAANGSRGR